MVASMEGFNMEHVAKSNIIDLYVDVSTEDDPNPNYCVTIMGDAAVWLTKDMIEELFSEVIDSE